MTWRQSILKTIYPLVMLKGKLFPGSKDVQVNKDQKQAPVSFYTLQAVNNHGDTIDFAQFKGKKIMIVNTAVIVDLQRSMMNWKNLISNTKTNW